MPIYVLIYQDYNWITTEPYEEEVHIPAYSLEMAKDLASDRFGYPSDHFDLKEIRFSK